MFSKQDQIQGYDDALLAAMNAEEQRQEDHIELIASENYTSKRVMEAQEAIGKMLIHEKKIHIWEEKHFLV